MKSKKKVNQIAIFQIISGVFIFCALLLLCSMPVQASQTVKKLRVAYYPLESFFEYDENNLETGYGVELLNKISQYTGIEFEYIPAESWESTKEMLLNGEADLRMPATRPLKPSTKLSYSTASILDTYNVMLTLKTRDDLYYQDYETLKTLKIAVSEGFYTVNGVEDYLDSIGITEDNLVFCEEYNDCQEMLMSGEVDALLSNIMDMTDDMKMLLRFNSIPSYFSMTINHPYIDVLDEAMMNIKLDEPLFLSNLYEKWFPERTTVPLTLEESEYLASIDSITFAFQPNEGYLSRYEDGTYYGIYTELAKSICEKLDIGYQAVSILDCQAGKDTTDVYAGFFYDRNYAEEWNFSLSAPINDINYYIIQKRESSFDPKTCRIAAIKKFRYTSDYLEKQYPQAEFLYFASYKECLEAVEKGSADMTIINNYIAEYYLSTYQFSDLSARLSTDYSHLFCFAAADNNEILASILTKGISMITEEEMSQLYILGQEQKPEANYFLAALYQNPIQMSLIFAAFLALIIAIVMLTLFSKKSRRQNRELEKALSAKSTFLARMSHDMRTPMNGILGLSYLMEEQTELAATKKYIPQLQESGKYLLQLIDDVLDINRIEGDNLTLHPKVCDEERLFDSIIKIVTPVFEKKSIDFHFEKINIEWQYMMLDEQRVKQIFVNLLGNAAKFTPEGGRIDFIMELVFQTDTLIRDKFVIRDTGIGMSREFLAHAFEPFMQEERINTDISNGTGLGLSIVKQLVELMDGSITIESEENKGTEVTVFINFPLTERVREEQQRADEFEILKGCHILMCEDHPLNAQIVIKLLEKKGALVTWKENGALGIESFVAENPGFYDAILMDIRMPVKDGLETARELRSLNRPDAKTIPMIALTANAYESDVQKSLEAGMNVHLAKPVEPHRLYEALAEQIKLRK